MRVCRRTTAKKAAQTFLKYAVVVGGVLSQVELPEGDITDKALLTIGLSTALSIIRAINNVVKTKAKPTTSGYVVVLAMAGLAATLAGCITTTAPDGTTTTQVDGVILETALTRYDRYVERKELLEREERAARAAQDAQRLALIQAELDKLDPEIAALAERLGL
jgi:hypothetical protein